jgi:hypothetical protein
MDYTSLIGPAVVAAVIAGIISVISLVMNRATTLATHSQRLAFDREQAERRVNAEIALAERKFALDRALDHHKRRADLAERTLIAFYEARDVFTLVRSRGIFGGEGSSRQSSESEGEDQKKRRDTYFVPIERLIKEKKLFARLQSLRYAFAANFGTTTREPFNAIWEAHNRIASSASVLIQLTFDGDDDHRSSRAGNEPLLNAIGWGPADRPDEIDQKIEKAVTDIEAVCRPVLAEVSQ